MATTPITLCTADLLLLDEALNAVRKLIGEGNWQTVPYNPGGHPRPNAYRTLCEKIAAAIFVANRAERSIDSTVQCTDHELHALVLMIHYCPALLDYDQDPGLLIILLRSINEAIAPALAQRARRFGSRLTLSWSQAEAQNTGFWGLLPAIINHVSRLTEQAALGGPDSPAAAELARWSAVTREGPDPFPNFGSAPERELARQKKVDLAQSSPDPSKAAASAPAIAQSANRNVDQSVRAQIPQPKVDATTKANLPDPKPTPKTETITPIALAGGYETFTLSHALFKAQDLIHQHGGNWAATPYRTAGDKVRHDPDPAHTTATYPAETVYFTDLELAALMYVALYLPGLSTHASITPAIRERLFAKIHDAVAHRAKRWPPRSDGKLATFWFRDLGYETGGWGFHAAVSKEIDRLTKAAALDGPDSAAARTLALWRGLPSTPAKAAQEAQARERGVAEPARSNAMQGKAVMYRAGGDDTIVVAQLTGPLDRDGLQHWIGGDLQVVPGFTSFMQQDSNVNPLDPRIYRAPDGRVEFTAEQKAARNRCIAFCDKQAKPKGLAFNRGATLLWDCALRLDNQLGLRLSDGTLVDALFGPVVVVSGDEELIEQTQLKCQDI